MSSATRRPRHYLRDHLGRALFAAGWTERSRQPTPPLWLPLVIRYSPSSYVNAAHSLRSGLNDWALCGNPFTTKAVSSLREAADNRAPGIIFARPYRNRGRSGAGCGWSCDFRLTWSPPSSPAPPPRFRNTHTSGCCWGSTHGFFHFVEFDQTGFIGGIFTAFFFFLFQRTSFKVFIRGLVDSGNSSSPDWKRDNNLQILIFDYYLMELWLRYRRIVLKVRRLGYRGFLIKNVAGFDSCNV